MCFSVFGQLSPALRNRFTEIWCPQSNSRSDLVQIIQHNLRSGLTLDGTVTQTCVILRKPVGYNRSVTSDSLISYNIFQTLLHNCYIRVIVKSYFS